MKVVGTKANINKFIKVIQADYSYNEMKFSYERHMFRVFEAEYDEIEKRSDGKFETIINGYCAWSVASCMLRGGYYNDVKKGYPDDFRGTTLDIESKILHLDIEVFSEESGCCFMEHYLIRNGKIEIDDCVDFYEYYTDEYETAEEMNEDLGTNITQEEFENANEN
jgi:hypothetical protein